MATTTVSTILKHVHKGTIETVYTLLDGEYEFIEAEILETSELISKSIKECEKLNLKYEAVAYTGKAASNLRSKCDGTGKTIHDFLYTFASKPKPNGEGYGKDWILDFSDLDILFIDECSMLSTQVPGFEVNGEKTYLFLEILEALKSRKIKKIMLLGDSHQLPPIYKEENKKEDEDTEEIEDNLTENLFPDSMNEHFLKNEFGLKGMTINLDTNWRYQEDFQAYKLSIQLRQHITIKNSFVSSPKKWITPKVDKNKLLIEKLTIENKELEDKLLRSKAEFENFRKRKEKEIIDMIKYEGKDVVHAMISIVDDLERLYGAIDLSLIHI